MSDADSSLISALLSKDTREAALSELSKKRETIDDIAEKLWNYPGVPAALLLEILSIYPMLFPPSLTPTSSTRVCNVLALFQCIAAHEKTREQFIEASFPLYLYPFLNTSCKTRPFEYLRLTSLGVIGALVKNENRYVIEFLLSTEIVPLCLRIMENGNELSKTVSIFIVQKILSDDAGLSYICQTEDRLSAVINVLDSMSMQTIETKSLRLLKHIIKCLIRLLEDSR